MNEDQAYKIYKLLERIGDAVEEIAADVKRLKTDVASDIRRREAEARSRSSYGQSR